MANIFYDRSGKAHVIGEKKKSPEKAAQRPVERSAERLATGQKPEQKNTQRKNSDRKEKEYEPKRKGKFKSTRGERRARKNTRSAEGDRSQERFRDRDGGGGRFERDRPHGKNQRRPKGKPHRKGQSPRRPMGTAQDNPNWTHLKGVIDKNKRGSAFLVFDRADLEDLFIPRYYVEQLFHGDRVEVVINEQGAIENLIVLQHRFKEIFGRVVIEDRFEGRGKTKLKTKAGFLIYERKKAKEEVWIPTLPPEVKNGDWVRAEVIFAGEGKGEGTHDLGQTRGVRGGAPTAKVVEVIGPTLPAKYDIQMVAGEFNLKEHHSFDAVKQAESYTLDLNDPARTDLRHIPFMTIDGERARDFDDAVYVERKGTGYRLWVAIADVSHYVKTDTPLDREAYERGTSVYFPERAFHMLPRALSEELCSLKPKVPRLSMACSIDYSQNGDKGEIKIYNAIIESRRRATYTEIQAEKDDPQHAEMFELYRILRVSRNERGSIDFDFPEAEIILDEKTGEPSDIVVRERQDSNRLIEEFMIAANESVTEWMLAKKLPFIYRIHDEPSPEAMDKFKKLARMMGVSLADRGGIPEPKVLAEFVRTLSGNPAEPVLANALLRSMRQAIYSATHSGHYGLASGGYTHFTSPIRRYPDLVVHRLLRAALARESSESTETLEQIAEHCSYRERVASEAERESIRFKQVRLMAQHLGSEFEGKITGLGERGMFVQLFSPYCEGMVPVDSIQDDWYEFSEERMVLVGRKKKRTFSIGMLVKIQVTRVDLDARQVEFQLVDQTKESE